MNGTRKDERAASEEPDAARWHGTAGGYSNHLCRCAECRSAWNVEVKRMQRNRVARETPRHVHGTDNGYGNYGCRCAECTRAHSVACKNRIRAKNGLPPTQNYRPRLSSEEKAARESRRATVRAERVKAREARRAEKERQGSARKKASAEQMRFRRRPFEERYVISENGCWIWQGSLQNGYGNYHGMNAHRWSYMNAGNDVPEGFHVDHLCRNRSCVNPEHLEAVTPLENFTRGDALGAVALRTGLCHRGHPFEGDNVRSRAHRKDKSRECVQCNRDRCRRYRAKKKSQASGESDAGKLTPGMQ